MPIKGKGKKHKGMVTARTGKVVRGRKARSKKKKVSFVNKYGKKVTFWARY